MISILIPYYIIFIILYHLVVTKKIIMKDAEFYLILINILFKNYISLFAGGSDILLKNNC